MSINNLEEVENSLNEVLHIAEQYGRQSEQFAKAKMDLQKAISETAGMSEKFSEYALACENFLEQTDKLIEEDKILINQMKEKLVEVEPLKNQIEEIKTTMAKNRRDAINLLKLSGITIGAIIVLMLSLIFAILGKI